MSWKPPEDEIAELDELTDKLEAENKQLRETLHLVAADNKCVGDLCIRLKVKNSRLRKLCLMFAEYVSQDRCEGCCCKCRCRDGLIDECWMLTNIRELASELEIEVD